MTDLEHQQSMLEQTLLRISGDIQVLEEELTSDTKGKALEPDNTTQKDLSHVNGFPSVVRV